MRIKPFLKADVPAVKKFTDAQIGQGYYTEAELLENQDRSVPGSADNDASICSFLLIDDQEHIQGLRLAFPPGRWDSGKGRQLRPDLWPFPLSQTAYFQSLFIAREYQGQNWGAELSKKSLQIFRNLGVRGVATHSWKESPFNSSVRYLEKLGFQSLIEHPLYWFDVDYNCTRDGKPCRCTAIEMYLTL